METKKFGLVGIGSNVQLGKAGPRVVNEAGVVEVKNAANDALVILRAAAPVGDSDVVTKRYLETRAKVIVSGQINGGAPPAPADGVVYIVTTAGGGFTLGELYRREAAAWVLLPLVDGLTISIADPLTGGTNEYSLGRYMYDLNTTSWILVGPISETAKSHRSEIATIAFNTASPVNIGAQIPENAIVTKVIVNVTQAFNDAGALLNIGDAGDPDRLMDEVEIDLTTVGLYVTDVHHLYGANTQVIGTLVPAAAAQGQCSVLVEYRLA